MRFALLLSALVSVHAAAAQTHRAKTMLDMNAAFVEGCSCDKTCTFETSGVDPKCHSLGGYRIDKGTFGGKDISGTRIAFVVVPGGDFYIYFDAPDSKRAKTAEALARTLFASYGKLVGASQEKISLTGSKGNMKLTIGKVASLSSKPVFGGDGKTPVLLQNVFGDPYDSINQSEVVRASVLLPGHEFELKGTSSFYLEQLRVHKKI